MFRFLTQQLEQHLQAYKASCGLSAIEGTVFPPEQQKVQHFSEFEVVKPPISGTSSQIDKHSQ